MNLQPNDESDDDRHSKRKQKNKERSNTLTIDQAKIDLETSVTENYNLKKKIEQLGEECGIPKSTHIITQEKVNNTLNVVKDSMANLTRAKLASEAYIAQLEQQNAQLEEQTTKLKARNAQLKARNAQLEERNARLEERMNVKDTIIDTICSKFDMETKKNAVLDKLRRP